MKTAKLDEKKGTPAIDASLKKYVGKNLSEKKTEALNQNLEQIKAALHKHSKVQVD